MTYKILEGSVKPALITLIAPIRVGRGAPIAHEIDDPAKWLPVDEMGFDEIRSATLEPSQVPVHIGDDFVDALEIIFREAWPSLKEHETNPCVSRARIGNKKDIALLHPVAGFPPPAVECSQNGLSGERFKHLREEFVAFQTEATRVEILPQPSARIP